jgi:CBS domain-containing protein
MDLTVGEVMSKDPYIVSPDTKIVDILKYFIHNKIHSALVDGEKQLFIFTTHDALKILKDLD